MDKKKALIIVISLAVIAMLGIGTWFILNSVNKYHIEMDEPEEITFEYGSNIVIPGVEAKVYGTIFKKNGERVLVESTENDFSGLGSHEIIYIAKYGDLVCKKVRKVNCVDTTNPVIELVTIPNHFTSPVGEYEEEGYKATDNYDGDITDKVERTIKDGVVYYSVKDSSGNEAKAERKIEYKDVVSPEIKFDGDEVISIEAGAKFEAPKYSAADDCDGDITKNVKVEGEVNTKKPGKYTLSYTVKDSSGNEGKAAREILVVDTVGPVITLKRGAEITMLKGGNYEEPGFSAEDVVDGNLTEKVEVSGNVDTNTIGEYIITYKVKDLSGNESELKRKVLVKDARADGSKIIYLTFDDGPGPYTSQLLDILDKYNVKVTFFVSNQFPKYQNLMAEEAKRGHTVAIHSYTHDYAKIYKSEEAFLDDLKKMSDVIEKQTGIKPYISRFPGGSSNAVSKKYCKGIMSKLVVTLSDLGYKYADWNVTSGDAGGTTSTEKIINNIISGCKKNKVSVVLQHDIKSYSVAAVEDVIIWGLANGYTFLPMDVTSPMAHHGVNN